MAYSMHKPKEVLNILRSMGAQQVSLSRGHLYVLLKQAARSPNIMEQVSATVVVWVSLWHLRLKQLARFQPSWSV